ncbi:MAG: FecR domain-containing protein [Alphaproteobacteria bacterium]
MARLDPANETGTQSSGPPASPDHVIEAGAGAVVLPYGDLLLQAEYSRFGGDLILEAPNGETVQITGYFNQDSPPDLFTLAGAKISAGLAAKLAGPQNPGEFAQASGQSALEEPIGEVDAIKGTITVIRNDGTQVTLAEGDPLFQGDTIVSGPGAALGIIFVDKSTMSMASESRIVLDELIYDPATAQGSQLFNVVQGAFVFTSGAIGKNDPDSVGVTTPVATIGIRGTKYAVSVDSVDGASSVTIFEGAVVVQNAAGTALLTSIGESTLISSQTVPPSQVYIMPPDVQERTYGDAISFHPPPQSIPGFGDDEAFLDNMADQLSEIETAAGETQPSPAQPAQTTDAPVTAPEARLGSSGSLGDDNPDSPPPDSGPDTTAATAETIVDDIVDGAEEVIDDVEDVVDDVENVVDEVEDEVEDVVDEVEDVVEDVVDDVEEVVEEEVEDVVDEVEDVIPEVSLSVTAGRGAEDSAIPLSIAVATTGETADYTLEIQVTGIPVDAILTNENGETFTGASTYLFTPEQLAGLTVTPAPNSSANFDIGVAATLVNSSGLVAQIVGPINDEVIVDAVADTPDLVAGIGNTVTGTSEAALFSADLNIQAALSDTNTTNAQGEQVSAESLLMNLYGIPSNAIVWNSSGVLAVTANSISLNTEDLDGLKITVPVGAPDFQLTLIAQTHEADLESGDQSFSAPIIQTLEIDVPTIVDSVEDVIETVEDGVEEVEDGIGQVIDDIEDGVEDILDDIGGVLDQGVGQLVIGSVFGDTIVSEGYGDTIYGGNGKDTLTANDSDDVLYGGNANDTLIVDYDSFPTDDGAPVSFGEIDGGRGTDTLSIVSGAEDHLSMSGDQLSGVSNIEAIDLSGVAGGATLSLSVEDLVSVSGKDDLKILLSDDDTVEIDGQQVTESTTFSHDGGEISLIIEQAPPPESIT